MEHTHAHARARAHTHTLTHVCTHTHTHTHTHTRTSHARAQLIPESTVESKEIRLNQPLLQGLKTIFLVHVPMHTVVALMSHHCSMCAALIRLLRPTFSLCSLPCPFQFELRPHPNTSDDAYSGLRYFRPLLLRRYVFIHSSQPLSQTRARHKSGTNRLCTLQYSADSRCVFCYFLLWMMSNP